MSTDNKSTDDYESFEDYAYEQYVNTFKDEKHWLIVYFSRTGTLKENWGFEGMQGNDTDSILYEKVTNLFNETLYKSLKDEETTVSNAFIKAFDTITPDIMTPTFYMDTSGIIVCSLLGGFIVLFTVVQIINSNHRKNIAKAVQVDGTLELKTCAHCGNSYYANSVTKCPKCGHDVEFLHIPHID